ncbi:MAG TPA: hypothetical protein PLN52_07675 [Opitutaceae bacterium]|nr:hypothetical protein [Opitutaceae bacterium]
MIKSTVLTAYLVSILAWGVPVLSNGAAQNPSPGNKAGETVLISVTPEGRLTYQPWSSRGDRLPDFSHCGYGGGGLPLPKASVRETLEAESGHVDDSPRIQAALDRVSQLPLGPDGLRGAVLLKRGHYRCDSPLHVRASGVVLRGEGSDENGTVLTARFRRAEALITLGQDVRFPLLGDEVAITDTYVPVGARQFHVNNTSGLRVGDSVFFLRRGNAAWITAIGMDRIAPRPTDPKSTRQWSPFDLRFDRKIVALAGDQVTLDAPLACAIDERWGGGAIVKFDSRPRIDRCGVEFLRAVSEFDRTETAQHQDQQYFSDEDHATYIVQFEAVVDGWARGLVSQHFTHGPAAMEAASRSITVEDCQALDPVSQITGGRRYPYHINGQLILVQRCFAERARHAFVFGSRVPGPNVFLDCRSTQDFGTSEPHHRWSVGGLYDNVETSLAIQDRQWMGSGHGWSGANYVAWNCRGTLICQKPPTAQNFAIGFVGKRGKDAFPGRIPGWWESEGTPVEPRSLYRKQVEDRLARSDRGSHSCRPL